MRSYEDPVEVVQRQLERGRAERQELSSQLLTAGMVCEQRLLEAGQILRPNIHARPMLLFRRGKPAGAALAVDGELCDEIRFSVRDNVDVAVLIIVFGTGLIA